MNWPNLGEEAESMPAQTPQDAAARETMDAADRLTGALSAMTGQLEDVGKRLDLAERTARRSRRIIAGLVISLVLDVTLTVLVTVFALQAHQASDQANATVAQLHASQIEGCRVNNDAKAKQAGLWAFVVGALAPKAGTPAAQKAAADRFLVQLSRHVATAYKVRDCSAAYRTP